ncbi:MAG TPA: hypothetical protein DCM05_11505 [Elusimicrobia bacterium]|nr:hypothetical protein [Elusimicrobiota bacterium]
MSKKILIVDDEPVVRATIRRLFEAEGYQVLEAADGTEVLELIAEERADLVILDIHMPRLDGIALIDDLHEEFPSLPIIVISGDAAEHRAKLAIERGACDFLAKPLDFDYLLKTVAANLLKTR